MTLTELRYIVALAREQHFGRAAERCHVSQPTLSVAVKKLEDELGLILFERSKTSVLLTEAGKRIVAKAQKVLEQAQGLRELAQAGKDPLGAPLSLGAIHTVGPYLFPQLVQALHQSAPQMPLYIEENFTHQLRDKLLSGELDVIIIALPFSEADVLCLPLYDEIFQVLLPANHPLAKRPCIDMRALQDSGLLLLGEGHCFRDQVLAACVSPPGEKRQSIEASSLETIRHMVASGLGVSVLPRSAIGSEHYAPGLFAVRPLAEPVPKRRVALAFRASFPRIRAAEQLAAAIRACPIAQAGLS